MKILVVHEINYSEKVIYEVHEFPELLALQGHEVEFLEFAEGFGKSPGKNPRRWIQKGRIYEDASFTIHSPWLSGVQSLDRLVALVTVFPVLWRLRSSNFDVILNFAVPTFGLQVVIYGLLTKTPVVHRALDISHKIRKSFWNPLIAVFERIVFSLSARVSANNPAMAQYVRKKSLGGHSKVVVNYPPSVSTQMSPVKFCKETALKLGVSASDFTIAYLGSFFYFSGLTQVIRDFAEASADDPSLYFLLIGGGEQEEELRGLAKSLGVESKVKFTGYVRYEDLPKYLSVASVAINPMEILDVSNYALPNKVLQYLALGMPVVSTKLLGLHSIFGDDSGISWAASPSEVLSLCLKIRSSQRAENLSDGLRLKLEQFSPSAATESLSSVLRSVS
jgi:glycosyltransferase involved in cell wall biosynthesis